MSVVLYSSVWYYLDATNTATRLLLMCWEGGWEWARLSVALDERDLDFYSYSFSYSSSSSYSYSYSYSYSLLIYTPGGGSNTWNRHPCLFSSFSSKDSHESPLKRNVFSSFLSKLSFLPKDFHTFHYVHHRGVNMWTRCPCLFALFSSQDSR